MPSRLLQAFVLLALLACGLAAAKEAPPGDQLDGGQPQGEALPASQCQEPWEAVDLGDATLLDFELLAADQFMADVPWNASFTPCEDFEVQPLNACSKATPEGGAEYDIVFILTCSLDSSAPPWGQEAAGEQASAGENTVALRAEGYLPPPSEEENAAQLLALTFLE